MIDARDEDVLPRPRELARDPDDLLGRLAFAENHLGHALPERAMMIDDRESEVRKRKLPQLGDRFFYLCTTALNAVEQLCETSFIHAPSLPQPQRRRDLRSRKDRSNAFALALRPKV